MRKYRKRPVEVEAVQVMPGNDYAVEEFMRVTGVDLFEVLDQYKFMVKTLEGDMLVSEGDWLICGVAGEVYPCKPDIFAATYDIVDAHVVF